MGLDMYLRKDNYVCTYDFEHKGDYTNPKKVNIVLDIEYKDGHKKKIKLNTDICETGRNKGCPMFVRKAVAQQIKALMKEKGIWQDVCDAMEYLDVDFFVITKE